ncbi:hypothetical protein ACEWY4_023206 [Coilia grayii]|uniref:G-protein coupled receptors family 1 profile domain-containing protein n=1 Tax=Coilia grayii TaxID=363190 RepID=A0ABD1J2E6_9TELE
MVDVNLTFGIKPNASCLCQSVSTYVVLPTLYSLMFLTGLPGNILALWVFVVKIPDKTPTHVYLINLGVSNLVLCLIMPFLAVYYSHSSTWRMDHPVCKVAVSFLTPVLHTNITLGMINLTWVALSRCATLIQNTHAHRPSRITAVLPSALLRKLCRRRFAWAVCLGTWALLVAGITPGMVSYSTVTKQAEVSGACYSVGVEVGRRETESATTTIIVVGVVIFFLCYLFVLGSYVAVTRHIFRVRSSTAISDRQRVYSRVFRNIVVIQTVLTVCLMPHHVFKAIFVAMAHQHLMSPTPTAGCHPLSVHVEVKNMLLCLATLRCSMDPVTYFLLDRTFRMHTMSLLGCSPTSQSSQSSGSLLDGRVSQVSKVHYLASSERTQNGHKMCGRAKKSSHGSRSYQTT